ncbi:MAG: nucleoside deaminase [Pyrinomonadaceae bacterium]
MTNPDAQFMKRAIDLARDGMDANTGGPFGCVIVRDGEIVGEGSNRVTSTNDPTAHAEVVAIRDACKRLNTFQLDGCSIYTSCEPCPMCLGAIYWARPAQVFYAGTRGDAAAAGFDDEHFYAELEKPNELRELSMQNLMRVEAQDLFNDWRDKTDKAEY